MHLYFFAVDCPILDARNRCGQHVHVASQLPTGADQREERRNRYADEGDGDVYSDDVSEQHLIVFDRHHSADSGTALLLHSIVVAAHL